MTRENQLLSKIRAFAEDVVQAKKQHFEEILLIPKTVHVGFFVYSWSTHHRTLGLLKHFHLPGLWRA